MRLWYCSVCYREYDEAGVAAMAVSKHGGRVPDKTPGTAESLPLIRERAGDYVPLTVDGGVRTGYDVLNMPAWVPIPSSWEGISSGPLSAAAPMGVALNTSVPY